MQIFFVDCKYFIIRLVFFVSFRFVSFAQHVQCSVLCCLLVCPFILIVSSCVNVCKRVCCRSSISQSVFFTLTSTTELTVQNKPSRNFHSTCGNKFYTLRYFLGFCFVFLLLYSFLAVCWAHWSAKIYTILSIYTVQCNVASNVMTTIH